MKPPIPLVLSFFSGSAALAAFFAAAGLNFGVGAAFSLLVCGPRAIMESLKASERPKMQNKASNKTKLYNILYLLSKLRSFQCNIQTHTHTLMHTHIHDVEDLVASD